MIVKLPLMQIEEFWPEIRHAAIMSHRIREKDAPEFAKLLLTMLLTEQAQAWVSYEIENEERKFHSVFVTRILQNVWPAQKVIEIAAAYSYRPYMDKIRDEAFPALKKFGIAQGCTKIIFYVTNDRIKEYAREVGMEQDLALFSCNIGE